jgi:Phage gp6-like head-tail connector protein
MHSVLEILQESTASAGPDLISLDDLKLALGITDTSEDAALQAAITFQSQIIADYCDRRFGLAQALETFTIDPGETVRARQALVLSLYPVVEIFEVSTAGATAADFHFDPASGRLWLPANQYTYGWRYTYGPYEFWPNIIAVTYTGGYDLPEQAPARLQRAVIEAVNAGRQSGTRDPTIREVQHGDTRISYVSPSFAAGSTGQHLSASVTNLIQPYRRLYIA